MCIFHENNLGYAIKVIADITPKGGKTPYWSVTKLLLAAKLQPRQHKLFQLLFMRSLNALELEDLKILQGNSKGQNKIHECCVFWPANRCSARCSLVEIIFFSVKMVDLFLCMFSLLFSALSIFHKWQKKMDFFVWIVFIEPLLYFSMYNVVFQLTHTYNTHTGCT